MKADIGMIGLAVMGENLARNMERNGFTVAIYNIEPEIYVNHFMEKFGGEDKKFIPTYSYKELVEAIEPPRRIMMMIKAGDPVDQVIGQLVQYLDEGDIIIDGGNSHFPDTARRTKYLEEKGFLYIGTGVSGGEEGALNGPSMMPGGSPAAWERVKPVFQAICAKTDDGFPCCDWVGESGAGHFVKMVHNGIEYGDMQLICEAYQIMCDYLGMSNDEIGSVFEDWNRGVLNSYLVQITGEILKHKDDKGRTTVDYILDTAGQKGTGKWTGISALDEGVPLTLIGEAVFARYLSSMKEERVEAARLFGTKKIVASMSMSEKAEFISALENALYLAKIISYAQGYSLMRSAAKTYGWNLNYGGIALMWRGGCIIRSAFLGKIKQAFERNPSLKNLLLDDYFSAVVKENEHGLRQVCAAAIANGIPAPAMTSALSYFDGYSCERLPANLLQAQRDYFGAHTYERIDAPRGQFFHTNWTGVGGDTASTAYNA